MDDDESTTIAVLLVSKSLSHKYFFSGYASSTHALTCTFGFLQSAGPFEVGVHCSVVCVSCVSVPCPDSNAPRSEFRVPCSVYHVCVFYVLWS